MDTRIPAEIIDDIAYGINTNPSGAACAQIILLYIINKPSEVTEKIRGMIQMFEYGHINFQSK